MVHEWLSLVEKKDENIYKDDYSKRGVKIRAKFSYMTYEQSFIFKFLLMNFFMKFILTCPFLVWMAKRYQHQGIPNNDDVYWNKS